MFKPLTRRLWLVSLSLLISSTAWAKPSIELSGKLVPGSAVLLQVIDAPPGSRFQGSLAGKSFPMTSQGQALVALDMETKPGKHWLAVTLTDPNGQQQHLGRPIVAYKRDYKTERINGLPKKKVELNPKDLTRAGKESRAIKATYKLRGGVTGYTGQFAMPTHGRFSGVFGSRRILNGKSRRPHNGVDIAAPTGTPIHAIAPAEVVLTGKDYFFTGNTVVLHHGHGVISLYAHMDSIAVEKGQMVAQGTPIGTIGMTGRVTGPHLHWGTLVRGKRVDPLMLPGIRK
uniref:M23ase beta-sheet core domain-containing protein n=1 Tax=Magnetococcus massalia (strain MO-1) TaxID=451514 RepID=A0A1S7LGF1_MAGMO|nr:Conserved protein of unknown function. Putative peptidase M23B [Candidatus Magnetococcus massalia]